MFAVIAFHCRAGYPGGFIGVDVFFVLSGYLITSILLREATAGSIDIWRFYLNRALRLGPALTAMLAAYILAAPYLWPHIPIEIHARDLLIVGLYLTDYAKAFWPAPEILHHTWSLAVEEHYYLIWPLAVIWLARLPSNRARILAMLALYALATGWRIANVFLADDWNAVYYRFDTRASGMLFGGLLAILLPRMRELSEQQANALALGSFAILFAAALALQWGRADALVIGTTIVEFASAGMIFVALNGKGIGFRMLSLRPLAATGLISYAMYLWHYPIAVWFREPGSSDAPFLLVLGLAYLFAIASWFLVERPVRDIRHAFKPA